MRTRIKICGITRLEDAHQALDLGADAIGLVFYPPSARAVSTAQAAAIVRGLPTFFTVVGLFVNAEAGEILEVLETVRIDALQFHGSERPHECNRYNRPYIKAVNMREGIDVRTKAHDYADSAGLLLDSHQEGVLGGSGRTFDWSRVPKNMDKSIILAGGLTPANVAEAILWASPFAVDVSGGVESAKGIKDAEKMAAFIKGVNSVGSS